MSQAQQSNLERYVRNNWNLRPIGNVTTVNSIYVDMIQIVDIYTRLARRTIEGKADLEQQQWFNNLMSVTEVRRGLY